MDTGSPEGASRRAARAALVLAIAAACSVGLVSVVNDLAQPRIAAVQRAKRVAQLTAVMGPVAFDNDPLTDVISVRDAELLGSSEPQLVHRVRRGGATIAVLVNAVAPDGYSGPIRLLVAVDASGRLLGVRVTDHRETPGLGDRIEERRSDWIHGFDGRSLGDPPAPRWQVRKDGGDFDQFTGATITPRAIVRAVRRTLEFVSRHHDELFGATPAPNGPGTP
jgi:electron transport complex protein RnfG